MLYVTYHKTINIMVWKTKNMPSINIIPRPKDLEGFVLLYAGEAFPAHWPWGLQAGQDGCLAVCPT